MRRTPLYWIAWIVLSGLLVAASLIVVKTLTNDAPAVAVPDAGAPAARRKAGRYEKVGYFTRWSAYGRGFRVKNLVTSGAVKNLTTIQYAFADLDPQGRCTETGRIGAGDARADYGRIYSAEQSVDGVADSGLSPLRGHFGQLQRLKKMYPGLKVNLSIGGWTGSKYFSNAALTPRSRRAAVASCLGLFLKGDLPELDGAGGPGSAKGLFDGIDLDWEWPGTAGPNGNVHRKQDQRNLTLLLAEFRRQLDALGKADGRHYALTMFLPAARTQIASGTGLSQLHRYLDFGALQGYDLHGSWEKRTDHQGNLYPPRDDPDAAKTSVDTSVRSYLAAGWPASKLVLGIPMYGRGWKGVLGRHKGLWQPASGAAKGVSEPGTEDYGKLRRRRGKVYRDEAAGAVWKYDGNEWWSYDDPALVAKKGAYIKAKGLRGGMFWSLDGDDANASLSTALSRALS